MKKIIIIFIMLFCIIYAVQADAIEKENYYNEAIDTIFNIGYNINDNEYMHEQFKVLRKVICSYCEYFKNDKEKQNFTSKIITKVAIGMAEHDINYLNEALIILQMSYNRFTNNIYLIYK